MTSISPQIQAIQQLEIEVGDIVDAIEPLGEIGLAEARMRRHDEPALCRQQRNEGLPDFEAAAAVKEKKRPTLSALK